MVHIEAIVLNKNLFRSKHGKSRTPSVSTYQHICNTPIQGSGILPSSRRLCQVHFPHNMPIPALTFSTSPRLAATKRLVWFLINLRLGSAPRSFTQRFIAAPGKLARHLQGLDEPETLCSIVVKQGVEPEAQNREPNPPNPAQNMKRTNAFLLKALEPNIGGM